MKTKVLLKKIFSWLFRGPSGLYTGLPLVVVLMFSYIFMYEDLDFLDHGIADIMFRMRGTTETSGKVVIVDIDEDSLDQLGQWPWPRTVVAELLRKLDGYGVKLVGLDIVFAEPDNTSLKNYLPRLSKYLPKSIDIPEKQLDNDLVLGEAVGQTPTILGYAFVLNELGDDESEEVDPFSLPFPVFSLKADAYEAIPFPKASDVVINVPEISQMALSEGFFNADPDRSGIMRKAPLFVQYGEFVYPSLVLEMAREGLDVEPKVMVGDSGRMHGVKLGDRVIKTSREGEMWLNYRGPRGTFEYISVIDVLNGNVSREALAGKYVLVGTSALGLLDLRATPYDKVFPGVEILATALDNVLGGDEMEHEKAASVVMSLLLVFVLGLTVCLLVSFARPIAAGLGGVGLISSVLVFNYQFAFLQQYLVWCGYVMVALTLVFLAATLTKYFVEGKEKRFLRSAFARYASKDVVAEICRNPEKLTLTGESKELSIFFSDIKSFSTFSEKLSAKQLSSFLNEYLSAMSDIAMEHRAYIDKYIGDAVMAFWGAPLDDEHHAEHAVRAGLRMLQCLDNELRKDWRSRGLPDVDIRIGINSGIASVGNMGSRERFNYTVMGDSVNLASRLEGAGKGYGLRFLISENTRERIGAAFFCRFVDRIVVKGKTKPVRIYEPLVEGEPSQELREEVGRFEKALELYFEKAFDQAEEKLKALNRDCPHPLYEAYLARLETFREHPPPDDWDGVYRMKTK